MKIPLRVWLIGSAALFCAGSAQAAMLENRWLKVGIDEARSADVLFLTSKEGGVAQVRPAVVAQDALLDLFSAAESAPRGVVSRFTIGGKQVSGSDLGPWKVLTSDPHRLSLESADGAVRCDYLLPEDEAMLTKRVTIRNRGPEPISYALVANLQVGGDYRLLTEPTSDFIYLPGRDESVWIQEARSDIKWEVKPSQPWFAVVDRNKNELLALACSHEKVTLLIECINELDQESLLATMNLPPVAPGETGEAEIYLTHAAGFSEAAYFGREALVAVSDIGKISLLPMSATTEEILVITGDAGESWEVRLERSQDSLPYYRTMKAAGGRYKGLLKKSGATFLINAKKTQHSEL